MAVTPLAGKDIPGLYTAEAEHNFHLYFSTRQQLWLAYPKNPQTVAPHNRIVAPIIQTSEGRFRIILGGEAPVFIKIK